MPNSLRVSRPWLAVVLLLFCLPLFWNLRGLDLETDEAIYSFAVDRILEIGDWLQPKSSPSETDVFLEKPPLKFWIVAAPIKLGLLPHNEFGLRFWDATFASVAFVYVFAIGSLLAGPICGVIAVLMLFLHWPLLLEHGLRSNNMESALFLSYCGGVYHMLAWARATRRSGWHSVGVGLYFVLGFMTKYVAAVFLPPILGLAALLFRPTRTKLVADRRRWLGVLGLVIALIAPWFIYAQIKFGKLLWETMLGEHVFVRFTTSLNETHVQPWNYYIRRMAQEFSRTNLGWLIPIGLVALLAQTERRRSFDGAVILLWLVPIVPISMGTSKLYHYAYPFLPPLTLAVGYLAALIWMLGPSVIRRVLEAVEDLIARLVPPLKAAASRPWVWRTGTLVIAVGTVMFVATLLLGQIRLGFGRTVLFRSSGMLRPLVAIVVGALLTRRSARVAPLIVALTMAWWIPVDVYKGTLRQLAVVKHPLRDVSECILQVQADVAGEAPPGLYVDTNSGIWHPIYYYFRRIRPWTRQETPSAELLERHLYDPSAIQPSLVSETRYRDYTHGPDAARISHGISPPLVSLVEYELLLPGPYTSCSPEARLHNSR